MKISLKWLSQFVDVAPFWKDPESLGELLTRAGLEVEEINDQRGQMKNVLVGIILKKEAHPQADRLSLCQVSTGEHVVHQIVCGAQNHKANDKVFIALPGAVLPGDFKIQKAVVRGVESGGMLCSAKELGLAADSDGLLILPPETKVGLSFADWSGQDDVLLELKVTPNRADCLSHWGLAREVGGLLGKELCPPEKRIPATQKSPQFSIEVQVQAPDECLRYSGRSLVGVRVGPSPEPVRRRLEALGIKPINNVVDATNYVMLELGQPLHAFDASEIRGGLLRVRKAEAGEPLKTLDGTDLKMKGGELVITDREGLLAMAGVIGGLGTGVKETTTEVFLESAYFKPSSVRKSSRLHGVTTDSAYRFTRGVDPDSTLRALDRAAELIREWAHAEPAGEVRDFYPSPVTRAAIAITADQVSESMGYSAEPSEIELWLGRMGCRLEKQGERAWKVTPPVHRFDLEIPMDLVEEFARLKGYENIPESFPALRTAPMKGDPLWALSNAAVEILSGLGFHQAMNFFLISGGRESQFLENLEALRSCGLNVPSEPVKLRNPLSEDLGCLRRSLSWGLLQTVSGNYHQGHDRGDLFEVGPVFSSPSKGTYKEDWRVSGVTWGVVDSLWEKANPGQGVFRLKKAIEELFREQGLTGLQVVQPENRGELPSFLHRGRAACIVKDGAKIGFFGELHPGINESLKIRVPVALFELDLQALKTRDQDLRGYRPFSRQPRMSRDLSLVVPSKVAAAMVQEELSKAEKCIEVSVVDQFVGAGLPAGCRSLTFRLTFQDPAATLKESLVNDEMQKALGRVKERWGIELRS